MTAELVSSFDFSLSSVQIYVYMYTSRISHMVFCSCYNLVPDALGAHFQGDGITWNMFGTD